MALWLLVVLSWWLQVPLAPPPVQAPEVEASLRSVVERFFEAQQEEDVERYLALWSKRLPPTGRPTVEQLAYIFESGDDRFTDLQFTHASIAGDRARVRVRVTRVRTDAKMKRPDGMPRVFTTSLAIALALVREDDEWRIVREGTPVDELAGALIDEPDAERRRALLDGESDLLNGRLVDAMFRRADRFAQQQLYEAAQQIYERSVEVARIVKDAKVLGHAIQNLANSLYFQRRYDEALPLYEERLAIEREAQNEEGIASALMGVATVRYTTYEYNAALTTYREALAIQEKLDDQSVIATTLISIGNVQYLHGAYDEAIAAYRRAEELKRKYYDTAGAAMALDGLGRVYSAQGDYASALAAYAGVLTERRSRNALDGQAVVLHSIGEIHLRLGNLEAARNSFTDARELFVKTRDLSGAGRTWQGTALVELIGGRPALGEKAYAESISACTSAKDDVCVARAQVGLAFALAAQQKYADAIPWYRKAIAAFTAMAASDSGFREPAARSQVGLAEALTGDAQFDAALAEAANARQTALALSNDDVLWRALMAQARAERKLKKPDVALGVAKAAVVAVRQMAANALDRPTQVVPRDTSAAYATLAVIQAEAGDAQAAFETAEEMRTHGLRLWLAANEAEIARGMTNEEREEERTLSAEVRGLLARRERIASLPKVEKDDVERLDLTIADAITRRTAARDRVFARLPALRGWRGLMTPANVGDLEAILTDPAQVLLAFVVDDHDLVILQARRSASDQPVVITTHVASHERQSIGERIAKALDTQPLSDPVKWREASADLFRVLPPSIVDGLRSATSVIIVPDDLLWRVPFEALPTGDGYLADRASVAYLPSVTAAVRSTDRREPAGGTLPVAIVSAPELSVTLVERLSVTAPTWTLRPAEIANAEADRITSVFKGANDDFTGTLLNGAAATPRAVGEIIAGATAVHVGAPFRLNSASPMFSPILLSPERDTGEKAVPNGGVLEVRDVFNLTSAASVVTFSDGAALSMRDSAAALPPVSWGWRAAGVPTLLVRRWGGVEERSALLLEQFYEQLKGGQTPSAALHAARGSIRAQDDGRAPGAWAGWLLVTTVPLRPAANGSVAR